MAAFEIVDLTRLPSSPTRGLDFRGSSIVGEIDTGTFVEQLDTLRNDLASISDTNRGFGLESVVVKLAISAEGKVAFIAKGSAEASIEVKFSHRNGSISARPSP